MTKKNRIIRKTDGDVPALLSAALLDEALQAAKDTVCDKKAFEYAEERFLNYFGLIREKDRCWIVKPGDIIIPAYQKDARGVVLKIINSTVYAIMIETPTWPVGSVQAFKLSQCFHPETGQRGDTKSPEARAMYL